MTKKLIYRILFKFFSRNKNEKLSFLNFIILD